MISKQINEILRLIQQNKDLIQTIRRILQVFPEGVLIRSLDPTTKQIILKFANDCAKQFSWENITEQPDNSATINLINPNSETTEVIETTISEFLSEQEKRIMRDASDSQNIIEQNIEVKTTSLPAESQSSFGNEAIDVL